MLIRTSLSNLKLDNFKKYSFLSIRLAKPKPKLDPESNLAAVLSYVSISSPKSNDRWLAPTSKINCLLTSFVVSLLADFMVSVVADKLKERKNRNKKTEVLVMVQ